jgi:D-3-phosphoglycerate dehydrogenase
LLRQRGNAVLSIKNDRDLLDQISSTAELAFGLLLTCARHLPLCFEAVRHGTWERHKFAGRQLRKKVLGIVGMGRLGTMMARYGEAFQMEVIGVDPHADRFARGVERVDLDTLLRRSDFISLHVHLKDDTRGMLGARQLAMFKPGASLINTSRGALIDEAALIREMESGRIAAAGLDVM